MFDCVVIGQVVPEGLAAMPPGPELAAALAGLEHGSVPNDDIVDVLQAQSRQLAHEQARMFSVMNEVLLRRPFAGPGEVRAAAVPDELAAAEVRAALVWTRRFADRETDLACALVLGLPMVQRALLDGRLDRGKAAVFAEHLVNLAPEQAEAICRIVVPVAGGLTPWQIAERIKKLILEIDPEYYQRRYAKAVRDRKVVGYLDAEGAAVVTASGLPAGDAAAALERIDALARAVRRAGHPNTLDQLRADVFLGLLDGTLHHLSREQIIATLLGQAAEAARAGGSSTGSTQAAGSGAGAGGATADGPTACGVSMAGATSGVAPSGVAMSRGEVPDGANSGAETPGMDLSGNVTPTGDTCVGAGMGQRVGIEIRVPLTAVIGLDQRPGEIPGWGPVTAATARATVARQSRAEWRWVVVDAEGRLVDEGITRRRPAGGRRGAVRGGVVELQVPEAVLAELAAAPGRCGAWARVVADVAEEHGRRDPADHVRDLDAHPDERLPRRALRRHVQVRDRCCTYMGCRAPARRADQDHTREFGRGGPTVTGDLGPACRHDHMLKTAGGWELGQPEPGVFEWISPLGRVYRARPEPILPPPPEPVLREPDPVHDQPADVRERPLDLHPPRRGPPTAPAPPRRLTRIDWNAEASDGDRPPF